MVGISVVVGGPRFDKPCLMLFCRRFAVGSRKLAGFTFAHARACALEDTINFTVTKLRNAGSLNNEIQPWTLYRLQLNIFT
jgi:hypothetical protein